SGEIVVRGGHVMHALDAVDAPRLSGAWFHTGDLGHLDADGFLWIDGRLKSLIHRGGKKIAPDEIEEVLLSHDDVREAVAFGMPDARLGEVVAAAVVLRPDAVADERALQEFVAARLAGFKVPVRIVVTDHVARNRVGKLLRGSLAAHHGLDAP